jgi:hypothetical protein
MISLLRREAALTGSLVLLATIVSLLAYLAFATDTFFPDTKSSSTQVFDQSEDPTLPWESTDQYRAEYGGIGLNVHAFSIDPTQLAVLYSIDQSDTEGQASPIEMLLSDETGHAYSGLKNSMIGSNLGVTVGIVNAGPYVGQGRTLTLAVTGLNLHTASGLTQAVSGTWAVTLAENKRPGAPVDYTLHAKVAPEIMQAGDLTITKAGGPELSFFKLVVDRPGQQGAIRGTVSGTDARPLSADEFRKQLEENWGVSDIPTPPAVPTPLCF